MKYQNKCFGISGKFWIAVLMTVLLCACSRFQGDMVNENMISLQAFFKYSRTELWNMGEYGCAYMVVMGFRDTEWFCVALPLLAALPGINDFAEQWLGGNYYLNISRYTRRRYALNCMWRAAWQGFFVLVLGVSLYAFLVYLKFPHYRAYISGTGQGMIAMSYGATDLARWVSFIKAVMHTGIIFAIMAMSAVLLVAIVKDRFLSISILVLMEYISMKLELAYGVWLALEYDNTTPPLKVILVQFLLPTRHLYFDQTFPTVFHKGYWLYPVIAGGIALIIVSLFICLVRRRSE